MTDCVMIVVGVPHDHYEAVLEAMGKAGAGQLGEYTFCSFASEGIGRFLPSAKANPHVGEVGEINQEPEMRIETFCDRQIAKKIIHATRQTHPYEEPAIYIIPLLDEQDL